MTTRKAAQWVAILLTVGQSAGADEPPCDCSAYRALVEPFAVTADLERLGTEALRLTDGAALSDGGIFEIEDFRRGLADWIPRECRYLLRRLPHPPDRITVRASSFPATPREITDIYTPSDIWGGLVTYHERFAQRRCAQILAERYASGEVVITSEEDWPRLTRECRLEILPTVAAEAEAELAGRTPDELESSLRVLGDRHPLVNPETAYLPTRREMELMQILNRALAAGSEAGFLASIARDSEGMSFPDQLRLLGALGYGGDRGYDHDRPGLGSVSVDEMLRAMRTNLSLGLDGYDLPPDEAALVEARLAAGQCRDIHSFLGRVAQAMGMREPLIATFGSAGSMHSVLLVRDPSRDDQVATVNYDEIRLHEVGGTEPLQIGASDTGIQYRLNLPNGHTVDTVPSGLGLLLTEAAGFSVRDVDPLARAAGSSLVAADVGISRRAEARLRAGVGTDRSGSELAFLSLGTRWGLDTDAPGQVGAVLGVRRRDRALDATIDDRAMALFYLRFQQGIVSDELRVAEDMGLRFEGDITGLGYVGVGVAGYEPSVSVDGDILLNAGVRLRVGEMDSATRATVRATARTGIGIMDIRDLATLSPALHHVAVDADLIQEFAGAGAGSAYLVLGTTVVFDELGVRGRGELGVGDPYVQALLGVEGRLVESMLRLQDGTERRLDGAVYLTPVPYLRLGGRVSTSLENDEDVSITGTVELIDPTR